MTPEEEERRWRCSAATRASWRWLLGAFVILMFAVSIAKIGMGHA